MHCFNNDASDTKNNIWCDRWDFSVGLISKLTWVKLDFSVTFCDTKSEIVSKSEFVCYNFNTVYF